MTFRFHTGSIKSQGTVFEGSRDNARFDSILVRLKETLGYAALEAMQCFDSILVRLKGP